MRAIVFCLLFLPALAHAQVVTVGAHGGVSVVTGEGAASAVKPVAGASVDISLFDMFALRLEAEYAENGSHIGASTGQSATDFSAGYLAIPINLRFDVLTGTVPLYLFAGSTIGALVSATEERNGQTMDVKSQLRPYDITLDLGGGIGYRFTPNLTVICDVRFSYGLIDTAKDDAVLAIDSWQTRNVKVVLGVSYTFNPLASSGPTLPAEPMPE
jgi:opacity protein-like surface antigen